MHIGESTKVWHVSLLLLHFLNSTICVADTFFHCFLGGSHLGLDFLDGLDVTIILFLFNWLSWYCWLSSKLFLLHLNLLLDGGFTLNKHFLELSGFGLGLGNGLNVFSVLINGWVFTSFLFG